MTPAPVSRWQHDHVFGQDTTLVGERRTRIVIGITAATMVVEIAGGLAFGSMALLADGLHMGSHAIALTIAGIAYAYTRRRARDTRFSFGTGKVNSLAGYTGALLLAFFSFLMAAESTRRFFQPVEIRFDHAILVAFVGLLVNVASIVILGGHHPYEEEIERPEGSLEAPAPPAEVGAVKGAGAGALSPGKPGWPRPSTITTCDPPTSTCLPTPSPRCWRSCLSWRGASSA